MYCRYQAGVVERFLKKAQFEVAEEKFCEGMSCSSVLAKTTH